MKKQEQASLVHDLGFGKGQAKSDMIYLLAHSGNITMLTFCQALFETDL